MKLAYDIHIHSVLSPCADELVTPNNILNMAHLNELDIVAVTDHNSLKQLPTIFDIAESYDFLVVPGVELQLEGGHLLAYFNEDDYKTFDQELEQYLNHNDPTEEQVIMDVFDLEVEQYPYSLTGDLNCSLHEMLQIIRKHNGVTILAHIDKDAYSLKNVLKREDMEYIDGMEVTKYVDMESLLYQYPLLQGLPVYKNSDSHTVTSLSRRSQYIDLEEQTIEAFLQKVRRIK